MSLELGIVIQKAAELERVLTNSFAAEGNGLGEKLKSVQGQLPRMLAERLWKIVHVRNKAAHEAIAPANIKAFEQSCMTAHAELQRIIDRRNPKPQPVQAKVTISKEIISSAQVASYPAPPAQTMPAKKGPRFSWGKLFIILSGASFAIAVFVYNNPIHPAAAPSPTHLLAQNSSSEPHSQHDHAERTSITNRKTTSHHHHKLRHKAHHKNVSNPLDPILLGYKGRAVGIMPNYVPVKFSNLRIKYVHGYHHMLHGWVLTGIIKNISHHRINEIDSVADFSVLGKNNLLGRGPIIWKFEPSLKPGQSQSFAVMPGRRRVGIPWLNTSRVQHAKSLGAVIEPMFSLPFSSMSS